jgi:1-acyl-sn-glycerol-3-phosphate acyltransferase
MSNTEEINSYRGKLSIILRMILAFSFIGFISLLAIILCVFLIPWRTHRIRLGNYYGKIVGFTIFGLAGIRPNIIDKTGLSGEPMSGKKRVDTIGPALVICNHCSTVDMWIGMWLNPIGGCGIAKKEILKIPFFGVIYWLTGHLLIDRTNLQKSIKSMGEVGQFVRENKLGLWIWPEGSRSKNGQLKTFKKGFVHMALATRLPILPIVTHNADLLWPRDSLKIRPGQLEIEVLPLIDTSEWSLDTVNEHVNEMRVIFRAALSERQRGPA